MFIYINNIQIKIPKTPLTILQLCKQLNIEIPKFCFHENLEIAGSCRICLVEIKNSIKPVTACSMPVLDKMEIFTETPLIHKARESVLEFLLLNHPLDCPICDQGGECDLQDQSFEFGSSKSRFFELKRGVEDKNWGPFIKTIMTRCIHCTRCVRFSSEICDSSLGTLGRGNLTEIGLYSKKFFLSEYSGNVIDLCPVGALTAKPLAFKFRSWEVQKINTVDIFDSIGSNLSVNIFNNEIVRILPKTNPNLNIEWISNKSRFFFDSLKYQRLNNPLLKDNNNNNFNLINWQQAFFEIKIKIKDASKIKTIIGNLIDLTSLFYLKIFLNNLGASTVNHVSSLNQNLNSDFLFYFLFNQNLKQIKKSDLCLLIGCDPDKELGLLNLYLKNQKKINNYKIYNIGSNLNFPVIQISNSLLVLSDILKGKHFFCKELKNSKNPIIFFGTDFLNKKNSFFYFQIFKMLEIYLNKKNIFNFLYKDSTFINFNDIYFKNNLIQKNSNFLFLYNTNNILKFQNNLNNKFIVYQGHHFTEDAQKSNLILPSTTFFEKEGLFFNLEGIVQKTNKILQLKNLTRNDIQIFNNLMYYLNKKNIKNLNFSLLLPYLKKKYIFKEFNLFYNLNNIKIIDINIFYLNKNKYFNNILEQYSKNLSINYKFIKTYFSNF